MLLYYFYNIIKLLLCYYTIFTILLNYNYDIILFFTLLSTYYYVILLFFVLLSTYCHRSNIIMLLK